MKKKITALILLCTACLVIFAAVGFSGAYAEENDVEGESFSDRFMYYLRDFVGKFPKREAFSAQENAASVRRCMDRLCVYCVKCATVTK